MVRELRVHQMKMDPQLPPPRKKIAKDAAQAMKRVDSLTTQAVTAKTLSDLLGLPGSIFLSGALIATYAASPSPKTWRGWVPSDDRRAPSSCTSTTG